MKPECEWGYTENQVRKLTGDRYQEFLEWMNGQTRSLCDGRQFNHKLSRYEQACNGVAHGSITYPWDVERFLKGLPIID